MTEIYLAISLSTHNGDDTPQSLIKFHYLGTELWIVAKMNKMWISLKIESNVLLCVCVFVFERTEPGREMFREWLLGLEAVLLGLQLWSLGSHVNRVIS